jgi:hypothetical protein
MAVQGFRYTLNWDNDFNSVDNAPAGFADRSARTKASVTLDAKLQARRDSKETDFYFAPSTVIVNIKAVKAESWVLKEQKSDKLLKHEQLHYNISALGGRDLERKILELRDADFKKLLAKKDELGKEIQTLIDKTNKDYDSELLGTNHGQKDAEQSKWELHLSGLMNDPAGELKSV